MMDKKLNEWEIIERHESIGYSFFKRYYFVVLVLRDKKTGIIDFVRFSLPYNNLNSTFKNKYLNIKDLK